jgi:glucose/arabinose dehydrogenase
MQASTACAVTVPAGFTVTVFLDNLQMPSSLAFGPDGYLYVATLDDRVRAAKDLDADGIADTVVNFAAGMTNPTGLLHHDGALFVSYRGEVARYRDLNADHVADVVDTILTGIPVGAGRNYDLTSGPDGRIYMGVGAATNLGAQAHPWSATILRFTTAGDSVTIFATGVRVAYDLAFNQAGALFAADNGPSAESTLCFEAPDELNWIRQGHDYGFPTCFGVGDCADIGEFCVPPPCGAGDCDLGGCNATVTDPIALFDPHSSPDGLVFGSGFAGFGPGDLFVAEFGQTAPSGGCTTAFGHRVSWLSVSWDGMSWVASPPQAFVTGLGRPLDVAIGPDGALYVADYELGRVYRIQRQTLADAEITPVSSFALYPNPVRDRLHLAWQGPPDVSCAAMVYDVAGRRIVHLEKLTANAGSWNLLGPAQVRVRPGIYVLRLACGTRTAAKKFVVAP